MQYNQIILSPPGIMGYAEYNQGKLNRYCDCYGNTITPSYDYVVNTGNTIIPSKNPSLPSVAEKQWMNGQMSYLRISFLSNTVQGYQINDDDGNTSYTDMNGSGLSVGINSLTEIHIIAGNVATPSWAS